MTSPSWPGLVLVYWYFFGHLLGNLERWSSLTTLCNSVRGKEKRFSLAKISSKQEVLQASIPEALTQEASCDEDCQHDTFKGWDGHSIDGSPSRDKGQASGRLDVPVDATAMIFDNVDVAPLHRSSQSVVLVNLGSHVEKIMKTVFVKGVDGKTKVRRVSDTTQIWEVLEAGIDVWVAVNGKRVEKDATMAQIGIQDQDTVRCYGRLLGGAQRYRQPPQDIPGQWTCSLCGQERVWPTKNRCFRCGNPKHQDPVSPGPVIGPTGKGSTKIARFEPDISSGRTPEQDFWSTCAFGGSTETVLG